MPFTVSHVAAVLPLSVGAPARRLVPAGLVIGSMVPDLPHFVPPHRGFGWTHAAYGPLTVDLAAGLVLLAVWHFLLHRPLVDFAPTWVGQRVPRTVPLRGARWGWAAVSVVIGAYTHVILDAFTHAGRWGPRQLPALNAYLGPIPVHQWLQLGLGVLGLLVLLAWAAAWLARAAPQPRSTRLEPDQRRMAWAAVTAVFVGSIVVIASRGQRTGLSLEQTAYYVATGSISLTAAVATGLCLVWQVDAWLGRSSRQGPADGAQSGPGERSGDQPIGGRPRR